MRVFLLLIFLKFIANTEATKPKSVNLALETELQFDHKNNAADVKFLDNVQEFLDKVRNVIRINNTRRSGSDSNNIKFTDFIKSVIDILKSYDDDDLEDAFAVFDDEIRKYHYRGCKFYELVEDHNVRRFVANKLEDIKDKPAEKLRQNLDNAIQIIDDAKYSGVRTEFLDYVNSLYRQDSAEKLQSLLNNLQTYSSKSKRANLNLIKVVRDGIRSIIFDHYSKLNANARRDLKIKLETSWKNLRYPDRAERSIWTVQYTNRFFDLINRNINDNTENIKRELTTPVATSTQTTTSDSESKNTEEDEEVSTTRYRHKKSHRENKNTEEVYFYKDKFHKINDNNSSENKPTTKATLNRSVSSESDSDELTSTTKSKTHKRKRKTKQHKQKTKTATTPKYVKPKKHRHSHKKFSTFVTLYPDEITIGHQKRFKSKATTRKSRLSTLWEEKIKHRYHSAKRNRKLKRSQSKISLRAEAEKPRVLVDSDTIISVKRTMSSEDTSLEKRNREMFTTEYPHQTRTTQVNYKPTTRKKYRKNLPKLISLEDLQSGISIESFEIKRRSLDSHSNSEQSEIKGNVMRRINNLEKQMEEVKIKINTKKNEEVKINMNTKKMEEIRNKMNTKKMGEVKIKMNTEKMEEFRIKMNRKRTTAEIKSTPLAIRVTNATGKVIATATTTQISTNTTTVTTKHNVNTFETTTNTIEIDKNNSSVETTTEKENITQAMTTESADIKNTSTTSPTPEYQDYTDLPDEVNNIGADVDNDIETIMKKYNISVTAITRPFSFDEILEESKPANTKDKLVSGIIEKDLRRLFSKKTTTQKSTPNASDPYQELNDILDLAM